MRQFNPPHPGEGLKEGIAALHMTVGQFADHIGISRNTLSRIVNGRAGITPEMSFRLSEAFGMGTSGIWFRMQNTYDLWHAEHAKPLRKKVKPIKRPAEEREVAAA